MKSTFWDDASFKARVQSAAKRKKLSLTETLTLAGVSPYYLKRPAEGRNTNIIMKLAHILEVPPGYLMGLSGAAEAETVLGRIEFDDDQLRRMVMTAHILALVVASTDPQTLMDFVMTKIHWHRANGTPVTHPAQNNHNENGP